MNQLGSAYNIAYRVIMSSAPECNASNGGRRTTVYAGRRADSTGYELKIQDIGAGGGCVALELEALEAEDPA